MLATCKNTVILLEKPQLNKIRVNILQITKNKKRMEVEQTTSQWSGDSAVSSNSHSHWRPTGGTCGLNVLNVVYGLHGDVNSRTHGQENENKTLTVVRAFFLLQVLLIVKQ